MISTIEKLKISSKTRSLVVAKVLNFFLQVTKVCLSHFFEFFFPVLVIFYLFLMFLDISF